MNQEEDKMPDDLDRIRESNAAQLDQAHRSFLSALNAYREKFESPALTAEQVFEMRLLRIKSGKRPIYTWISWWDEWAGPFRPGNTYVLAGYYGAGKTTLAVNLAWSMAKRGISVWYYCLDLSSEEVMEVLAGHVTGSANVDEAGWTLAYSTIQGYPFRFFEPAGYLTWEQHLKQIEKTVRKEKMQFIVIDNLSFLTRVKERTFETEGVVSARIKALAQELQIPILVIHHLRKPETDGKEPEPNAHSVRGSGAIMADASDVFVLHHPLSGDEAQSRHQAGYILSGKPRWSLGGKKYVWFTKAKRLYSPSSSTEYPRGGARVRKM